MALKEVMTFLLHLFTFQSHVIFMWKKKLIDKKRERVDKTVNRFLGYTVEKDIQIVFIQQLTD